MKYGIRLKINVSKIDKDLLFRGQKGVYLNATVFLTPDQPNDYGDHGMITQDVSKEAREAGEKGPILGNAKVFFTEGGTSPQAASHAKTHASNTQQEEDFSDPIPF